MGRTVVPGNQAPSSSNTNPGRSVIRSPRGRSASLLRLGGSGRGSGRRRGRRAAERQRYTGRGSRRRGAKPLLQRVRGSAAGHQREREREPEEDDAAPPGGLGEQGHRL